LPWSIYETGSSSNFNNLQASLLSSETNVTGVHSKYK
jgi:hypothetical protein